MDIYIYLYMVYSSSMTFMFFLMFSCEHALIMSYHVVLCTVYVSAVGLVFFTI